MSSYGPVKVQTALLLLPAAVHGVSRLPMLFRQMRNDHPPTPRSCPLALCKALCIHMSKAYDPLPPKLTLCLRNGVKCRTTSTKRHFPPSSHMPAGPQR